MKLIGIVGGLSWEATALYYRLLNEAAAHPLGPYRSAGSVIDNVDFVEALACPNAGDWDGSCHTPRAASALRERASYCLAPTLHTSLRTRPRRRRNELQHIIIDELTVGRVEQRSLQAP